MGCSVEDTIDDDDDSVNIEKPGDENYEESAKHIKVVETDFKRPLRSSFRAKKGEKRISAVLFDADPVVLSSPTEQKNLQIINHEAAKPEVVEASDKSEDVATLTEQDFLKLNFGLRSKIRRDSLDKPPLKT